MEQYKVIRTLKEFDIKSDALKYEKYLKSLKSKEALTKLSREWRGGSSSRDSC